MRIPPRFCMKRWSSADQVSARSGSIGQAVVDLPPGEYVIWNEDFTSPTGVVTVTGEAPADMPEPEAGVTVTAVAVEDHFDFQVEASCRQAVLIKFHNDSDQPLSPWRRTPTPHRRAMARAVAAGGRWHAGAGFRPAKP